MFSDVLQHFAGMKTSGDSIYDALIEEAMEKGYKEGFEKGMKEGREEALRPIIRNMLENGMSPEEIIRVSGLDPAEFERLSKEG